MKGQNSRDSLEILYDEFQIPIIICLMYFIFQLPIVKSKVLSILPSLFNKDGNPNLSGYVFNSMFFGIAYYVISKSLIHLQNILGMGNAVLRNFCRSRETWCCYSSYI